MSRLFTDESLLTWEVFASGGPFGLPSPAKVVFQCLSDPDRRARLVQFDGDNAEATGAIYDARDETLVEMLKLSVEID